jgi:AraC-like DNA-binding protein
MGSIDRHESMGFSPLTRGESTRFFACRPFEDLDCLTATFRTHCYVPHTHDTYVVGSIVEGCETWTVRGIRGYATPGRFVFINPGEVHDGAPHEGGYSYRMSYPSIATMQRIASEMLGRPMTATPFFPTTVVHDLEGAALFVAAHEATERGEDLAGEELFYRAYAHCLACHAGLAPTQTGRERAAVERLKALMIERHAEDLTLAKLAAEAGLPRHHLIRAFRREMGLTPHAFLVDRRIIAAQARLKRGETPAEAAAATGFSDQAHLTRAFKARLGVTPGAYRVALAA